MTVTTDTEALVRRAYHYAQGDVLDVQGFVDLFADDGVFNGIGGVVGQESYRGEHLGDVVVWMGKLLPDVHRELHRVNVLDDFWYVCDGKIQVFNCHVGTTTMFAQLGILPDFASAVEQRKEDR
jgi:hypothetical protein